jgi:Peptidase family M28
MDWGTSPAATPWLSPAIRWTFRSWERSCRRSFPWVHHFARSDHQSFWRAGVPAIMVTDTADFRNSRYHGPEDVPETLDYERIADVTVATALTVATVAGPGRRTVGPIMAGLALGFGLGGWYLGILAAACAVTAILCRRTAQLLPDEADFGREDTPTVAETV